MSDTFQNDDTREDEVVADAPSESKIESPVLPGVAVAENAQVGDENTAPVRDAVIEVDTDPVKAQVTGPPAVPVDEVYVHETYVTTDTVITDPASPEAVQIPDAGRGTLDLPIHQLGNGTVEDVFRKADAEAAKQSD